MFDVRGLGWVWVGLGQLLGGLGWAGSMKIDPRTTLAYIGPNSKTERPRKTKIGTVLAHVIRDSDLNTKANKCEDIVNLQGAEAYCVATRTACYHYMTISTETCTK